MQPTIALPTPIRLANALSYRLIAVALLVLIIVAATPRPAAAQNPPFPDPFVCEFDLTFVADLSASVSPEELEYMKDAFIQVIDTLGNTTSNFSFVTFSTEADLIQDWTSEPSVVNSSIDAVDSAGGFTNWQQALVVAGNQYRDGRDPSSQFNVIIFASDGDPTAEFTGPGQNLAPDPLNPGNPNPFLPSAVEQAEAIWADGTRIITIGISDSATGAAPNEDNLLAISSADALFEGSFEDLAVILQDITVQLCAGTISVVKVIDGDGDPGTLDHTPGGAGWIFEAAITPGSDGSVSPPSQATDETTSGATFNVTVVSDATTVVLTEDPSAYPGYSFLGASCIGNDGQPLDVQSEGLSITLDVGPDDIISCTFVNTALPTTGLLIVQKQCVFPGGDPQPGPFAIQIDGEALDTLACGESSDAVELPAGAYTVSEEVSPAPDDVEFGMDCGTTGTVEVVAGETSTCLITNTYTPPPVVEPNQGVLVVEKRCVVPGGMTPEPGPFDILVDGQAFATLDCGESSTAAIVPVGEHTVTEVVTPAPDGVEFGMDCDSDGTVQVSPGGASTCLITNTYLPPDPTTGWLIVEKQCIRPGNASGEAGPFTILLDGDVLDTLDCEEETEAIELEPGDYTVRESVSPRPDNVAFTGDCDNTGDVEIVAGEISVCIIVNLYAEQPPVGPASSATPTATATTTASPTATRPATSTPTRTPSPTPRPPGGIISPPSTGSGGLAETPDTVWFSLLWLAGLSLATFTWYQLRKDDEE